MLIDKMITWTIVNLSVCIGFAIIATMLSWGFRTMAERVEQNFDPVCHSQDETQ